MRKRSVSSPHWWPGGTLVVASNPDLGYYHGIVDGIMGPQTRAAIAAYQGRHNLAVDGTISQRLLARMDLV